MSFKDKIFQTGKQIENVPVYMLLYGNGGIGKSTFASTAPKPFLADFENGSKFFGIRGINVTAVNIETWGDFAAPGNFVDYAIQSACETIILDPIGEALELAKRAITGTKFKQPDGSLTAAGWGELKTMMTTQLRKLRDSGKNVILIGHVEEKDDEGRIVKRPKVQTKLSEDIVNMVDIVAYMYSEQNAEGESIRVISVDPSNDKIVAKDRTGSLPKNLEPDFKAIQAALNAAVSSKAPADNQTPPAPPAGDAPADNAEETADNAPEAPEAPAAPEEDKKAAARAKLQAANAK